MADGDAGATDAAGAAAACQLSPITPPPQVSARQRAASAPSTSLHAHLPVDDVPVTRRPSAISAPSARAAAAAAAATSTAGAPLGIACRGHDRRPGAPWAAIWDLAFLREMGEVLNTLDPDSRERRYLETFLRKSLENLAAEAEAASSLTLA